MPDHKVYTARERTYPFRPFWKCACGHRLKAVVMGPSLYKEFKEHKEKK